jgi:hypothetical protein
MKKVLLAGVVAVLCLGACTLAKANVCLTDEEGFLYNLRVVGRSGNYTFLLGNVYSTPVRSVMGIFNRVTRDYAFSCHNTPYPYSDYTILGTWLGTQGSGVWLLENGAIGNSRLYRCYFKDEAAEPLEQESKDMTE